MVQNKTYLLKNNQILTNKLLSSYITRFWNEIFIPIINGGEQYHLMILCKVQYSDNKIYKTIGPLRRVELTDKDLFIDYLSERLGILIDSYDQQIFNQIIFTYIIKKGGITTEDRLLLQDTTDKSLQHHEFNKIKLPISMNPLDYGKILTKEVINGFTRYITTSNKRIFQLDISLDNMLNIVTILGASDFKWTDTLLADGSFKREIGKATIYFLDGERILEKKELNA